MRSLVVRLVLVAAALAVAGLVAMLSPSDGRGGTGVACSGTPCVAGTR